MQSDGTQCFQSHTNQHKVLDNRNALHRLVSIGECELTLMLIPYATGGYCLRNDLERDHTIQFLQDGCDLSISRRRSLRESLDAHWNHLDEMERNFNIVQSQIS